MEPLTWFEQLAEDNVYRYIRPKIKYAKEHLGDHIIVHLSFPFDHVTKNTLDARYSIYTMIANLGGTLGLYVQITGASILTIIHLLVLMVKALFGSCDCKKSTPSPK